MLILCSSTIQERSTDITTLILSHWASKAQRQRVNRDFWGLSVKSVQNQALLGNGSTRIKGSSTGLPLNTIGISQKVIRGGVHGHCKFLCCHLTLSTQTEVPLTLDRTPWRQFLHYDWRSDIQREWGSVLLVPMSMSWEPDVDNFGWLRETPDVFYCCPWVVLESVRLSKTKPFLVAFLSQWRDTSRLYCMTRVKPRLVCKGATHVISTVKSRGKEMHAWNLLACAHLELSAVMQSGTQT